MLFVELKDMDKELAYWSWLTVSEAKELNMIPKEFTSYFKDKCSCGSENIITNELTHLTCCDPKCPIKQGFTIAKMFTRFGIKGLQESTCSKIYTAMLQRDKQLKQKGETGLFKFNSYLEILLIPYEDYPAEIKGYISTLDFYNACNQILATKLSFPKLISNLGIPNLEDTAEKIFSGFSSFEEVYQEIKKCGTVQNFCKSKGSNSELLAFNLRVFIRDIAIAANIFKNSLKMEGAIRMNVSMTGSILLNNTRITKARFLELCNDKCIDSNGVQLFEFKQNDAINSNPFILYSTTSNGRKFRCGKSRGNVIDTFGTHPVLFEANQFYNLLERIMEKWNVLLMTKGEKAIEQLPTIMKTAMTEILSTTQKNSSQVSKTETLENSQVSCQTINSF